MSGIPFSVALTATPAKIADIKTIGNKLSVHVPSSQSNAAYVYLTEQNPSPLSVSAYTIEVVPGALYETPTEHVGEVWAASSSTATTINVSKYG